MTDTEERPIITEVKVRAMDLKDTDTVHLHLVYTHRWEPAGGKDGQGRWGVSKLETNAIWRTVYDVNNTFGDSSIAVAQEELNDAYTLLRLSLDGPNNVDFPDEYVAIQSRQLVTVQHENRSF